MTLRGGLGLSLNVFSSVTSKLAWFEPSEFALPLRGFVNDDSDPVTNAKAATAVVMLSSCALEPCLLAATTSPTRPAIGSKKYALVTLQEQ